MTTCVVLIWPCNKAPEGEKEPERKSAWSGVEGSGINTASNSLQLWSFSLFVLTLPTAARRHSLANILLMRLTTLILICDQQPRCVRSSGSSGNELCIWFSPGCLIIRAEQFTVPTQPFLSKKWINLELGWCYWLVRREQQSAEKFGFLRLVLKPRCYFAEGCAVKSGLIFNWVTAHVFDLRRGAHPGSLPTSCWSRYRFTSRPSTAQ